MARDQLQLDKYPRFQRPSMSITFCVTPFSTHPTWDAIYLADFLRGSIDIGPFHAAFGQTPTEATLSVTISPDGDTHKISGLLQLCQDEALALPNPPTSAYDLHVGVKIEKWEHMYQLSEVKIMPTVRDMIKKLTREGGLECMSRFRQHRKECETSSLSVIPLPLDFAEGQVLAKLALLYRIKTGFSRAHCKLNR